METKRPRGRVSKTRFTSSGRVKRDGLLTRFVGVPLYRSEPGGTDAQASRSGLSHSKQAERTPHLPTETRTATIEEAVGPFAAIK